MGGVQDLSRSYSEQWKTQVVGRQREALSLWPWSEPRDNGYDARLQAPCSLLSSFALE